MAVLISPGYGEGWATEAPDHLFKEFLYHPRWVRWVEEGKQEDPEMVAREVWGENYPNISSESAKQLVIKWVPEGAEIEVKKANGSESLEYLKGMFFVKCE